MTELHFPEGWIGCPEWRRFTLDQPPEMAPVAVLQSLDQPELSFIVVDPRLVAPDYSPSLAEADRLALGVEDAAQLQWWSVLTVHGEPFRVTANLLGPLAIDSATGTARQVVLSNSGYLAAHSIGDQ